MKNRKMISENVKMKELTGILNEGYSSKIKKVLNNPSDFFPGDGDEDFTWQEWEELDGYIEDAFEDGSWDEAAKFQLKIIGKDRAKKLKSFLGGIKGVGELLKAYGEEQGF